MLIEGSTRRAAPKKQTVAEAGAGNLRRFFGITPELEELQPGHTAGVVILYVLVGVILVAILSWGARF